MENQDHYTDEKLTAAWKTNPSWMKLDDDVRWLKELDCSFEQAARLIGKWYRYTLDTAKDMLQRRNYPIHRILTSRC
jgi:hypothetical protein